MNTATDPWWQGELAGCAVTDARLGQRLRKLIEPMQGAIGASLSLACQDGANTKAASRFFANDRVSEAEILAGHFRSTRDRFAATDGPILVVQDTTEFTFQRKRAEAVGITCRVNSGRHKAGRLLGEPPRCVHIGDRESDISELFCTAEELGSHFIVCSCVDRLAGDGDRTIANEMDEVRVEGVHAVEVRDSKGRVEPVAVELRYRRIRGLAPIGKQKRYPALTLTLVHATEPEEPADRPGMDWKLITDLPVLTCEAAIETLRWYAMRWKIEVFHNILKSGCRVEEARLRTAERLVKLIAVLCILSWRVFWMTMIHRVAPRAVPGLALTDVEIALVDRLVPEKAQASPGVKPRSSDLIKIARLGGYLARSRDPPPGSRVMWRGLSRLTDIALGITLTQPVPKSG